MSRSIYRIFFALLLLLPGAMAPGHAVQAVTIQAQLAPNAITASIKLGALDASTLAPGTSPAGEPVLTRPRYEAHKLALATAVAQHFKITSNGNLLSPSSVQIGVATNISGSSHPLELATHIVYHPPAGERFQDIQIDPNIFRGIDEATSGTPAQGPGGTTFETHISMMNVTDCGETQLVIATGEQVYTTTLPADCPPIADAMTVVATDAGTTVPTPIEQALLGQTDNPDGSRGKGTPVGALLGFFLWQGAVHILFGWDHIFFVIGLVVVAGNWKNLVKVVTAFTVAHSVTLILTASDFMTINQPTAVEAIIALSIAYIGAENLLRKGKPNQWRWIVAFIFGLVHGMGFAGALKENIGETMPGTLGLLLLCLLVFNIGVELGQVAIIAVVYPLLQALRKSAPKAAAGAVVILSMAVLVMGISWFLDRTTMPGVIPWVF